MFGVTRKTIDSEDTYTLIQLCDTPEEAARIAKRMACVPGSGEKYEVVKVNISFETFDTDQG
jgi:hypothetical protein